MFHWLSRPKASSPDSTFEPKNSTSDRSPSNQTAIKNQRRRGKPYAPAARTGNSSKASRKERKDSKPHNIDVHPLNLPPDERERRRSALMHTSASLGTMNMDQLNGGLSPSDTPDGESSGQPNGHGVPATSNNASPPQSPLDQRPDAEACKAAGNKFFKAGDYAKAVAEYSRAIEADPRNPTYLSNRSAAYIGANRYGEALEDARQAESLEPNNSKILLRIARIYTALGRPSEALEMYAQIQPPVAAKDRMPASAMQNHVQQAELGLREGTAGSMVLHALDQAERGLGTGVGRPRKWQLLRGEAYLKMGNANALGDAQTAIMSLLRSNSYDPDALVLRGRILYAQGENEKAIQHFRQALSCDPDFKVAVKYLRMVQRLEKTKEEGNVAFKAGRYDEAVRLYGDALEVDPANRGTNSKILQNRALASIKVNPNFPKTVHVQANARIRS